VIVYFSVPSSPHNSGQDDVVFQLDCMKHSSL